MDGLVWDFHTLKLLCGVRFLEEFEFVAETGLFLDLLESIVAFVWLVSALLLTLPISFNSASTKININVTFMFSFILIENYLKYDTVLLPMLVYRAN